jgi:hypothetical protein
MKKFTTALNRSVRYAFFGLLGLSLLSSCKKNDPYDFEGSAAAEVNLINASTDASPARLYVDGILRTPNAVAYGDASGYYKTIVGNQGVEIKSATGEAQLATATQQFDAFFGYTFFLVGQNSNLSLITVSDNLASTPASGKARIRFVNASQNASAAALTSGTTLLVAAQNFRGVSEPTEVNAGTYQLAVVSGSSRSAVVNANLESGKIYTIYAKGLVGGANTAAFTVGVYTNK